MCIDVEVLDPTGDFGGGRGGLSELICRENGFDSQTTCQYTQKKKGVAEQNLLQDLRMNAGLGHLKSCELQLVTNSRYELHAVTKSRYQLTAYKPIPRQSN